MRDDDAEPTTESQQAAIMLGDRHVRMLRIAVIAMGVVLVLGFIAVIARIVYLVNRGSDTTTAVSQPIKDTALLALPAGAVVRNLSLSGNRLAVHYDSPTGGGIVVLDLQTGAPVSRIQIVPDVPR